MLSKPWTPEEDEIMRREYGRLGRAGVARLLGRSLASISGRAGKLGLREKKEACWSRNELRFLLRNWGKLTEEQIAKKLHRTPTSIDVKAKRLRLGPCKPPGSFSAQELSRLLGLDIHCVMRWIDLGWIPAERRVGKEKPVLTAIMVQDVERFLQEHPEAWDSRKAPGLWSVIRQKRYERDSAGWREPGKRFLTPEKRAALGNFLVKVALEASDNLALSRVEPEWLLKKREADNSLAPRRFQRWSEAEKSYLRVLLRKPGMTYREIGEILGRSATSVEHCVHRMYRPRKEASA